MSTAIITKITAVTTLAELEQILREEKLEIARIGLVGEAYTVTLTRCFGVQESTAQARSLAEAIQCARVRFVDNLYIGDRIVRLDGSDRQGVVIVRPKAPGVGQKFQVRWNDGRRESFDIADRGKRWERV